MKPFKMNRAVLCFTMAFVLMSCLCTGLFPLGIKDLMASAEKGEYPDKLGREAIRLWTEKERSREADKATQMYWNYHLSRPPLRHPPANRYQNGSKRNGHQWEPVYVPRNNGEWQPIYTPLNNPQWQYLYTPSNNPQWQYLYTPQSNRQWQNNFTNIQLASFLYPMKYWFSPLYPPCYDMGLNLSYFYWRPVYGYPYPYCFTQGKSHRHQDKPLRHKERKKHKK